MRELLLAERRPVHEVWMSTELRSDPGVADIVEIAEARRVRIDYVAPSRLDREAASEAPQGVLARAASLPEASLQDLLARGGRPFLVALDHVTDPGNVGAIVRIAEGAGVTGLILPRHRAAHVTPTVAKASAGAIEHVPIALVGGLPAALRELRAQGVWIIGLDDAADRSVFELDDFGADPICIVLGAEGAGLSRLVRERCDVLAAIPMHGRIGSLNVSAAAAISVYELSRSRRHLP